MTTIDSCLLYKGTTLNLEMTWKKALKDISETNKEGNLLSRQKAEKSTEELTTNI